MDRIEAPLVDRIFTRLVFSCDTKSVADFVSQFGPKKFGPEFGPLVICFGHAAPKISVQNSEGQSAHTACVQIHGSGPVCDSSEPKPCNPDFQHKNVFDLWDLGIPEIKSRPPKGPGRPPPLKRVIPAQECANGINNLGSTYLKFIFRFRTQIL